MSTAVYGSLVREQENLAAREDVTGGAARAELGKENKLITAVAALIPIEVIWLHALILSFTTTTETTITSPTWLKWSVLFCVGAAVAVYLIARGFKLKTSSDWVRLILPPSAFLAWAGIMSTSVLTPWIPSWLDRPVVVTVSGFVAVILVAISARVNPPKPR